MPSSRRYPTQEHVPEGHGFAETRDMNNRDQFLRRHGFKIVRRPSNGEAVWGRGGHEYMQSVALRLVAKEMESVER